MTNKFAKWTNPATGEIRIYCNALTGVKIWAEKTKTSYIIKSNGRAHYSYANSGKCWAIDAWFDALKSAGFETSYSFGGTFEEFEAFAS